MTSWALPGEFVDRVALEDAEEAEIEDPSKILDHKIKLLLLDQKILVINFVIQRTLFLLVILFFLFNLLAFIHSFIETNEFTSLLGFLDDGGLRRELVRCCCKI